MASTWEADPAARPLRRLGKPPAELGTTGGRRGCPDVWEMDNGDIAVIGRDLTETHAGSLPAGMIVGEGERLVVIPRITLTAAKPDIPDA